MAVIFFVPAAVLLAYILSVISLILERGQFDAAQTAATAPLLALYAIGLPGMGLALLGGRVLLAQGRGRAFMVTALAFCLSTVALDYLLYQSMGAKGLALAFTIGSWAQAVAVGSLIVRLIPIAFLWRTPVRWCLAAALALWALVALPAPTDSCYSLRFWPDFTGAAFCSRWSAR